MDTQKFKQLALVWIVVLGLLGTYHLTLQFDAKLEEMVQEQEKKSKNLLQQKLRF